MKRFILFLLIMCFSIVGYSEMGFGRKHREHNERYFVEVLKELNLTPTQTKMITSILRENRTKIREIEKQIIELRKANQEIIKNYPPDKEKFLKNQEKIGDLLKQIHIIRAKGYIEIISILDNEQYRIFIEKTQPKFFTNFSNE